jgi:hypothetical protein
VQQQLGRKCGFPLVQGWQGHHQSQSSAWNHLPGSAAPHDSHPIYSESAGLLYQQLRGPPAAKTPNYINLEQAMLRDKDKNNI